MKRFVRPVALLLLIVIGSAYLPVKAQSEEDFASMLASYAQTHTRPELEAYALELSNQLVADNWEYESYDLLAFSSPKQAINVPSLDVADSRLCGTCKNALGVNRFPSTLGGPTIYRAKGGTMENSGSDQELQCRRMRNEACRLSYSAEVLQGAAISTGVFGGCNAISALSSFIVCTAAALAMQAMYIAAARSNWQACRQTAAADCQQQFQ
jgi:hypothetical protein